MEELTHNSIVATYEMYDGETLIEQVTEQQPMRLMTDFGMMPLTALEEKLKAVETGCDFKFELTPAEAFGEYEENRIVDLEKEVFSVNGVFDEVHIRVGEIVPLQNEDGDRFLAQIKAINEDTVTIDLNHPMAGKTLTFKGHMIDNHVATQDEIMALLNQMNAHHGCGGCGGGGCSGGCGNCGGSCGSDCGGNCGGEGNCDCGSQN